MPFLLSYKIMDFLPVNEPFTVTVHSSTASNTSTSPPAASVLSPHSPHNTKLRPSTVRSCQTLAFFDIYLQTICVLVGIVILDYFYTIILFILNDGIGCQ